MGGVDVDGERPGARARPGRPGSGERFAGDLVELTGRPQVNERKNVPSVEDAATRWPSTCPVAPARSQSASPIHVPPANAECTSVMAFSPTLAAPGASPKVDALIEQLAQQQSLGQRGGQDQAGVGDQVLVIEADRDGVGTAAGSHLTGAFLIGSSGRFSNPFSQVNRHELAFSRPI